jgi:hypothetical protein
MQAMPPLQKASCAPPSQSYTLVCARHLVTRCPSQCHAGCCCAALLIPFQTHTLRVRHTMHGDTCVPPYLPFVFALMFHRSFRPSTPSWQSELYLQRARVSLTSTTAVTHAVSIPLYSQARSRYAERGANNRSSMVFQNGEVKHAMCSNFVLWWQAFFREAASQQSRVISSTRKALFREAASQQSRFSSSTRKSFLRDASSQQPRVISSTRKCESNDCQPAHTPNARLRASQSIILHHCAIAWSLAKRGAGAHTKVVSEVG